MTVTEGVLVGLVAVAAFTDLHSGKIPNWLTYPACVFGLVYAGLAGGSAGLVSSLLGLALGFAPFFVLYLMGGLGGGDVKLMAAVGALAGYPFVLDAMISAVLIGGAIAFLIVIWEGKTWEALRHLAQTVGRVFYTRLRPTPLGSGEQVPFGVAICLGCFLTLVATWLGHESPSRMMAGWLT